MGAAKNLADLQVAYENAKGQLAACEDGQCEAHAELLGSVKKKLDEQDKVVRLMDFHTSQPRRRRAQFASESAPRIAGLMCVAA